MAFVRVEQRNAGLATAIRLDFDKGRDGEVAKGTVTIISNTRRGASDDKAEEATAIQWTLWGKQAENAADYLGIGSRVNVIGRMRNNNYDKDGAIVYGFQFACEEIDYLDSRAEADARRLLGARPPTGTAPAASAAKPSGGKPRGNPAK